TGNPSLLIIPFAVIVAIVLICLVVSVLWIRFKHSTPQQTQSQTGAEFQTAAYEPEEEVHYGEVNFQQRGPKACSVLVQDSEQQETVYAQVKLSADNPGDIYAQAKKS
ncbi:hypothetical protein CHARACLAT_030690, partial [Characodon lateralis]|nr:hypothetical protein [Characodon lateralis]